MMELQDIFVFDSADISSYHELGNYLCREVFTDMSVLPLVFPSNISCFSSGSYKEELSRTRELPVPPQPKRTGVLARSDDNLAGAPTSLLSSLPHRLEDSQALTRHSSYTWLREEDEEEDTCLLATQLRRRYEEVRRAAVEQSHEYQESQAEQSCELQSGIALCTASTEPDSQEIDGPAEEEQGELQQCQECHSTNTEEKEVTKDNSFDKMSVFKKKEKASLFQRTIDRLSFKSRKKKDKDKTFTVEVITQDESVKPRPEPEQEIKELDESPKMSPRSLSLSPVPVQPTPAPALPTSARYLQSRPLNQLDQALKNFKLDTAKSRENLSLSRPDLSVAISVYSPKTSTPRTELKSSENKLSSLKSSLTSPPPQASSARWRQVAPSTNKYVESEWARLSASMMNLSRGESRRDLSTSSWRETNLSSSNMSLDLRADREEREERGGVRLDRAVSVSVLSSAQSEREDSLSKVRPGESHTTTDLTLQVPQNQLRDLNSYQRRVQASMEKLNVPSWCKSLKQTPTAPPTPTLRLPSSRPASSTLSSSWRTSSLSSNGGWRRTSTLDRRDRARDSGTLPALSSRLSAAKKQTYLGWRSQERLDIGPVYLTSPAQRLASSAVQVQQPNKEIEDKEETVTEDIKEVTDAILDYCSTPVNGKPVTVKQAWMSTDGEESDNSDNPDDDSGIDRSDDFTQEILNEA